MLTLILGKYRVSLQVLCMCVEEKDSVQAELRLLGGGSIGQQVKELIVVKCLQ